MAHTARGPVQTKTQAREATRCGVQLVPPSLKERRGLKMHGQRSRGCRARWWK